MTDQVAVLLAFSHQMIDERDALFSHFENKWIENPLVMDKWFTMQALSAADDTFERVQSLLEHRSFSLKNPNKVRALVGAFSQNHFQFHHESGRGYEFLAEIILQLDRINPQIAARLTSPLISWKRYEPIRKEKMKSVLKHIQSTPKLSRDVFEIASKGLKS
jgi:aminopeptidase N